MFSRGFIRIIIFLFILKISESKQSLDLSFNTNINASLMYSGLQNINYNVFKVEANSLTNNSLVKLDLSLNYVDNPISNDQGKWHLDIYSKVLFNLGYVILGIEPYKHHAYYKQKESKSIKLILNNFEIDDLNIFLYVNPYVEWQFKENILNFSVISGIKPYISTNLFHFVIYDISFSVSKTTNNIFNIKNTILDNSIKICISKIEDIKTQISIVDVKDLTSIMAAFKTHSREGLEEVFKLRFKHNLKIDRDKIIVDIYLKEKLVSYNSLINKGMSTIYILISAGTEFNINITERLKFKMKSFLDFLHNFNEDNDIYYKGQISFKYNIF